MMRQGSTYYPFMDTFRGVAILWVILQHVNAYFDVGRNLGSFGKAFERIAEAGSLGVDMFFVISGFLITGILLEGAEKKINIERFYIRRFFKIIPQYMTALVVGLFLSYGVNQFTVGRYGLSNFSKDANVISHFFFFQNYVTPVPTLAHTWSLAVEEHFYLCYPLLLALFFSIQKNEVVRRKWIITIFIVLILLINTVRMLIANGHLSFLWGRGANFPPFFTTLYRVDALIFGALLKLLERFSTHSYKSDRIVGQIFLCVGLFIYAYFIVTGVQSNLWYTYTLSYLAPGAIFLAALKGFHKTLDHKWLRWVGKHSYGIYLWHIILIFPLAHYVAYLGIIPTVIVYVFVAIAAGVGSTVTIERYFLNLRAKIAP